MAQFILLLRNGDEGVEYTPEQIQVMIQQYFDWSAHLRGENRLKGGEELKPGGKVVRRREGQMVVDGPFAETKEGIGGFYHIEASSFDEALEVAQGCPVLNYGGAVEVREVNEWPQ